jgi:hypothetical protein
VAQVDAAKGKKPASGHPPLLGITKPSLSTDSFISWHGALAVEDRVGSRALDPPSGVTRGFLR